MPHPSVRAALKRAAPQRRARPCSVGGTPAAPGGPPCGMAVERSPRHQLQQEADPLHQCSAESTEPYGDHTPPQPWGPDTPVDWLEGQRLLAQIPCDGQGFFERWAGDCTPSPASSTHRSMIEAEYWEMQWIERQRALSTRSGSRSKGGLKGKFLTKVRTGMQKTRLINKWKLELKDKRRRALEERRRAEAYLEEQKGAP